MKPEPFVIERLLNAPIEKVWKAITDKEQMKQWYFDLPDFKPEPGFEFQFEGGDKDNIYVHLCKVTEVIPGKKLQHSWRYKGYEGNSFVTWELFAEGNQTRLKLTHEGLETFPANNPSFAKENSFWKADKILGSTLRSSFAKDTAPIVKKANSATKIFFIIEGLKVKVIEEYFPK